MIGTLLISLLLTAQSSSQVKHFHEVAKSVFPKNMIQSDDLCPVVGRENAAEMKKECWQEFQDQGKVWEGDLNDDGVAGLIVFPGAGWTGSSGNWYFLYQKRGDNWVPLYAQKYGFGWQVENPRFDILPVSHGGFHDLRIATDWCLKWNGKDYVDYEDSDYHRLSPKFFDGSDWKDAEIFWAINYAGANDIRDFKPRWYSVSDDWWAVAESAETGTTQVEDPEYGIEWIAPVKDGVWGWKDDKAFLILPRPTYIGSRQLELSGEWLLIHGESSSALAAPPIVARYNRRTHELRIEK